MSVTTPASILVQKSTTKETRGFVISDQVSSPGSTLVAPAYASLFDIASKIICETGYPLDRCITRVGRYLIFYKIGMTLAGDALRVKW